MRFAFLPLFAACTPRAPADSARGGSAVPVTEVVTFRLIPGVSDPDFVGHARSTEAALAAQPGFLRRSLLRDASGLWTDLVAWRSLTDAEAAARAMMTDAGFAPFMAAIDMGSVRMQHLAVLWQMGD